jgi:predicted amidohydrolase
MTMRLAAYQMVAAPGDVPRNLATIVDAAGRAKAAAADLLVVPELATTGYGIGDALFGLAEDADGEQTKALGAAAERLGIGIVAGFAERAGNAVYNAALLATPAGARHVYRKCQLYGDYEKRRFARGPVAPAVFDLGGIRLGILICFDVEFPELVRRLAVAGADVVAVPTALPDDPVFRMIPERVISVRAFENQIAVVYANHADADPAFSFAGRSVICLPDGSEAARAPAHGPALIFADYEPSGFAASRAANAYLSELRTDL